ncbi:MAG TPA: threonine synthase [Gemmataceae bacterium]|jgi:threonine synthase
MADAAFQRCIHPACAATLDLTATDFRCPRCGGLLDVAYDWDRLRPPKSLREFEAKWSQRTDPLALSGVWRFRELLPFAPPGLVATVGEGQTLLRSADAVGRYVGLNAGRLFLQYEGLNPSGSFKDNGMTAAFTHARLAGARRAACASTGNTSSSLALYCAATGLMAGVVFVGSGKIAHGKLAQALDHGVLTLQIAGDFDDAMRLVREVAPRLGIYLVNSVNPFRLEGQKAIMYRVLEALGWEVPDWVVVPGGNLGNMSAFGKAFAELAELGLIDHLPRLAVINAAGANTFFELFQSRALRWDRGTPNRFVIDEYYRLLEREGRKAATVASAIEINRPVNLPKALRALETCGGVVRAVSDQDILDAKAQVGAGGFGCEPASAASVAGARLLAAEGVIGADARVVCVLTGHALKDPAATVAYHTGEPPGSSRGFRATFANRPIPVAADAEAIVRAIEGQS